MVTNGVCDYNDCGQTNEFEFKAYYRDAGGAGLAYNNLRIDGVPSTGGFQGNGRIQIFP